MKCHSCSIALEDHDLVLAYLCYQKLKILKEIESFRWGKRN